MRVPLSMPSRARGHLWRTRSSMSGGSTDVVPFGRSSMAERSSMRGYPIRITTVPTQASQQPVENDGSIACDQPGVHEAALLVVPDILGVLAFEGVLVRLQGARL